MLSHISWLLLRPFIFPSFFLIYIVNFNQAIDVSVTFAIFITKSNKLKRTYLTAKKYKSFDEIFAGKYWNFYVDVEQSRNINDESFSCRKNFHRVKNVQRLKNLIWLFFLASLLRKFDGKSFIRLMKLWWQKLKTF